ncbi:MAG: hypothetical protein SOZ40_06905 [Ezakiella sp.]|nr:hypothetical protein [Ezakiella sp.]
MNIDEMMNEAIRELSRNKSATELEFKNATLKGTTSGCSLCCASYGGGKAKFEVKSLNQETK